MINKVVLVGRLTSDPEFGATQSGTSVTTFTLAVERNFPNQQGEREADFIPVVTWRGLAQNCSKYLSKGRLVAVSGRIQKRIAYDRHPSHSSWSGSARYITEVIADEVQFLEWGDKQNTLPTAQQDTAAPEGFAPVDDDDLPF